MSGAQDCSELLRQWQALQGSSDPLFMSIAWRETWWDIWGGDTKGDAKWLLVEDGRGPLALAPVYLDRARLNVLGLSATYPRLQMIGCSYGHLSTPRAEYNAFLLRQDDEESAFRCLAEHLEALPWGEAVFEDVVLDSAMDRGLRAWAARRGWRVRQIWEDVSYVVNTSGAFSEYLAGLGSNTRLRMFNRRKLLDGMGRVERRNLFPDQVDEFFSLLNDFHRVRWGAACYGKQSLAFQKRLLNGLHEAGAQIDLALLVLDERPLSVLYNIRIGGRIYNVQSGYIERFHDKLSLGGLHLGFAIEEAFADPDVSCFDLLAGGGKVSDYKRHFAKPDVPLRSYKIVRSGGLGMLYWCKDHLLNRIQAMRNGCRGH